MSDKLQLPDVTLFLCDCINADKAIKVMEHCKSLCDFGDVKFLSSIPVQNEHLVRIKPLNSLVAYSIFMLTKSHEYINTSHFLTVQCDGWILNPQSFNPEWMDLDFIGGLYMQYDKVGSGGFSLRSKKIMEHAAAITPEWDWTQKKADEIQSGLGYYEDGIISLSGKFKDFKIASLEQAADFSQAGNRNPLYFREYPFGFHRTHQLIDFSTGRIDSSDTSRDITQSYHQDIETL